MKAKVKENGVLLSRDLLGDAEEVEIVREEKRILVIPVAQAVDPIVGPGTDPVSCGLSDAADNHDRYLYTAKK